MSMSNAITRPGLETLKARVAGAVFVPADGGYDAARLVLRQLNASSRPQQSAGPTRWPVRRSALEGFLSTDNSNDRAGRGRLETDRAGSGGGT
jgi:hypothetical protein